MENSLVDGMLSHLASAKGQKADALNIALPKEIIRTDDKKSVHELVKNLHHPDKKIQSDCIKVLYEIGYEKPELIAAYFTEFLKLLEDGNNRLVWGAMIALSTITDLKHGEIFGALDTIVTATKKGSVITRDNSVKIILKLNRYSEYFERTDSLLRNQLQICPIKQLPLYLELAVNGNVHIQKNLYRRIVENRISECENGAQRKRLDRILRKLK